MNRRAAKLGVTIVTLTLFATAPINADPAVPFGPDGTDSPITPVPHVTAENLGRVALGAALFADTRLSGDGRRSCASCHDLTTNGASANRFDRGPDGSPAAVNTPTVFNAALSFRQSWSGKFRTLELQAQDAIEDPRFMDTALPAVAGRLAADRAMAERFRAAYGHPPDAGSVTNALASFERTLLTPDSPFDRWLQGDSSALASEAISGYQLFRSIGCVSCHQGRNVGGNLLERAGIFRAVDDPERPLMRVPSLRNVAVTPPYFQRGGAATLEDAVHTMADTQLGRPLSDREVAQIVSFLNSLTGTYQGRPLTRP